MKIINQYHEIISVPDGLLQILEKAARTCYKSEDKITADSAEKFVQMLINRGHHAMIEFGDIIVKFVTNRGVSHELVRHRLCSFAQESTRYVNYNDKDIQFITPVWYDICPKHVKAYFQSCCYEAEISYGWFIQNGWRPEQAREVLPNALKTEIIVKANIREWRHIFELRTTKTTHPQMRALMIPLLKELKEKLPIVFDDIHYTEL